MSSLLVGRYRYLSNLQQVPYSELQYDVLWIRIYKLSLRTSKFLLWIHRRRMDTEGKAKVVVCRFGGAKFVPFLAALAVLPRSI